MMKSAEKFRHEKSPVPCMKPIFSSGYCSYNSMLMTRPWAFLRSFTIANRYQARSVRRSQSTVSSPASTISPALLGRAQALAAEHAELSKQLQSEYDMRIAKKAGSLSAVAIALNNWESASNVCLQSARQTHRR